MTFSIYDDMKKSFIEGWEESWQKNETALHTISLTLAVQWVGKNGMQWDLTSISVSEMH